MVLFQETAVDRSSTGFLQNGEAVIHDRSGLSVWMRGLSVGRHEERLAALLESLRAGDLLR